MKIRCGSHQQNRSIVRPGLSLMATKVALTAEEFRENSQRSIDLFNTEKLSTDSTHVRKKCILQFCAFLPLQSARGVWRQSGDEELLITHGRRCNLHGACGGKDHQRHDHEGAAQVAICTGRVEAKLTLMVVQHPAGVAICTGRVEAKGYHEIGGNDIHVAICTGRVEAKHHLPKRHRPRPVAICTGRVEAKAIRGRR